ncbi:cytochrome c oxidase accessory protein CcoG [soil metagenome]
MTAPEVKEAPTKERRTIPIVAVPEEAASLYVSERKVYPRSIKGVFASWRWAMVFVTQLVFYGMPWIDWGERQMVLFDLAARRFYVFGLVLYPQDFIYLTGLLVVSALALFLFTAVAGRLWCGFTCPQTVYSEMFLWIEAKIEGERGARMRLDGEAASAEKLVKKTFKHILWLGLSLWTGFTFVGYFTPIRELGMQFLQTQMGSWNVFWSLFYGFATYGNAGFMREQVCKYMCPYARFQSAMFDRDTLIVGYDAARGDVPGPRARGVDARALGLGDCTDCGLCVQVCPVGIDIRNGLQYECIGCGLCVDACNSVMDKMHYPRGLIRFSTQNAIAGGWSTAQIRRRMRRPRVLIYTSVFLLLACAMLVTLSLRVPLKVDVVRDRGALSRIAPGGRLENVFRLQIMNATETAQAYVIGASGLPGLSVQPQDDIVVAPTASRWVVVTLQIPYGSATPGSHPVTFEIMTTDGAAHVSEKSVFLVPR